jgi:hypothetical protein
MFVRLQVVRPFTAVSDYRLCTFEWLNGEEKTVLTEERKKRTHLLSVICSNFSISLKFSENEGQWDASFERQRSWNDFGCVILKLLKNIILFSKTVIIVYFGWRMDSSQLTLGCKVCMNKFTMSVHLLSLLTFQ